MKGINKITKANSSEFAFVVYGGDITEYPLLHNPQNAISIYHFTEKDVFFGKKMHFFCSNSCVTKILVLSLRRETKKIVEC